MDIGKRIAAYLLVGATFLLSLFLTFVVLSGVGVIGLDYPRVPRATLYSFGGVVMSLGCALFLATRVARTCANRWNGPSNLMPQSRWVVVPLLAAYLLTWAVGVPAVQSANTSWAINHSIGIMDDPQAGRIHYPCVQTYVSFPVLPFVVASLHENQTAPLAGWGGWDFQLWYGVGTCRLFRITLLVS